MNATIELMFVYLLQSPDLSLIENLIHFFNKNLNEDAIAHKIIFEKYEDFQNRVLNTRLMVDIQGIDP